MSGRFGLLLPLSLSVSALQLLLELSSSDEEISLRLSSNFDVFSACLSLAIAAVTIANASRVAAAANQKECPAVDLAEAGWMCYLGLSKVG